MDTARSLLHARRINTYPGNPTTMAVPDYQTFLLPLLRALAASEPHALTTRESVERMAEEFELSDEDRTELLPSGTQRVLNNRVGWAATYLKKAGLMHSPRRGHYVITERGQQYLATRPTELTREALTQFAEFRAFVDRGDDSEDAVETATAPLPPAATTENAMTPREQIEALAQELESALADQLLETIYASSPDFFERLVVDVLLAMGYGGTHRDAGRAIGKSGDEGLDGVINEDRLGLDRIYVQAKRWDPGKSIGRPEIQKFAGALQGARARKGVFISTSSFTTHAHEYVARIDSRIVLIGGRELASLMIEHGVGVTETGRILIKRMDSDYFEGE